MRYRMAKGGFKRLAYVDVFRGFALIYMVVCHLFTYFSEKSVYTSRPYFIPSLNIPTPLPPPYLFLVVAGMSVWLMISKRKNEGYSGWQLAVKGIRRYGIYVLISLPFTWFMFGLETYYTWSEAIQGIGLAALLIAIVLSFRNLSPMIILFSSILIFILKPILEQLTSNMDIPYTLQFSSISGFVIGLVFNMGFRGWFSLVSAVPMLLVGVAFIQWFTQDKAKIVFLTGLSCLIIGFLLHSIGLNIDYYNRTPATIFFIIAESAITCSLLYFLVEKRRMSDALKSVSLYGFFSIYIYLGHFLFIAKPLMITGIENSFSEIQGWILSTIFTTITYLAAETYTRKKRGKNNFSKKDLTKYISVVLITIVFIYSFGYVLNGLSAGKKILVIAAHPDDETNGVGEVIAKNTLAGNHVRIIMVTDGAPEEFNSSRDYKKQRERELFKAMDVAGVSKRNIVMLDYDDLNFFFEDDVEEIFKDLSNEIRDFNPDEIYTHAYEHGNVDHDALNYLTVKAIQKTRHKDDLMLFEYSNYNPYGYAKHIPQQMDLIDGERYPFINMTGAHSWLKREMMKYYISQDVYGICDIMTDWPKPTDECANSIWEKYLHPDYVRAHPGYDFTKSPCINDSCRYNKTVGGIDWTRWYERVKAIDNILEH